MEEANGAIPPRDERVKRNKVRSLIVVRTLGLLSSRTRLPTIERLSRNVRQEAMESGSEIGDHRRWPYRALIYSLSIMRNIYMTACKRNSSTRIIRSCRNDRTARQIISIIRNLRSVHVAASDKKISDSRPTLVLACVCMCKRDLFETICLRGVFTTFALWRNFYRRSDDGRTANLMTM